MHCKTLTTYTLAFTMIIAQQANAFSWDKISSKMFRNRPAQEVIEKEYALNDQQRLVVDNVAGDITIKTAWERNSIALKASINKGKDEEVHIIDDISNPKEFALRTIVDSEKSKSTVHYEIIIPSHIKLQLSTNKGNINVKDAHGATMATTDSGSITLNNMHNKVLATTRSHGSINCSECAGIIEATTNKGHIRMSDVQNTVIARTTSGKINVHCKELPKTSKLDLSSKWGNITIALPEVVDADIKANTQKGTCVCDHYVTLRPQTTKLNSAAWTHFKRSIDGTTGNGTIPVQVSSVSSNIRINATSSKVS